MEPDPRFSPLEEVEWVPLMPIQRLVHFELPLVTRESYDVVVWLISGLLFWYPPSSRNCPPTLSWFHFRWFGFVLTVGASVVIANLVHWCRSSWHSLYYDPFCREFRLLFVLRIDPLSPPLEIPVRLHPRVPFPWNNISSAGLICCPRFVIVIRSHDSGFCFYFFLVLRVLFVYIFVFDFRVDPRFSLILDPFPLRLRVDFRTDPWFSPLEEVERVPLMPIYRRLHHNGCLRFTNRIGFVFVFIFVSLIVLHRHHCFRSFPAMM